MGDTPKSVSKNQIIMTNLISTSKIQKEIYKDIKGYEGIYQASNLGNIRSLNYNHTHKTKTLRGGFDKNGYKLHVLSVNNIRKTITAHRVIATLFIENTYNKRTVNHKNGIKSDNRAENLEWSTLRENIIHAVENGFRANVNGINNPMFGKKYTEKEKYKLGKLHRGVKKNYKNNSSEYVGVSYHKLAKKWRARISYKNKEFNLGLFKNEHDAHLEYQKALHDIKALEYL